MEAHQNGGQLHRAFSVLVFNTKGELLLQQRAFIKYHCPGLRANTTCSHPRLGESYFAGAHRRLQEEMGFDCPLEEKFHFVYKAEFANGLTEYEFDRVFFGQYEGEVVPNPEEVADFRRVSIEVLKHEMAEKPGEFAEWFRIIMEEIKL
ncbi:MAG: isopentenyl-diphosphate Delta-isomerase [Candidatus Peribacteria bacterium]|jgi:isopentenyl-diphosphate delta-isomerase|nr:isopentenyl-diphosphate Delta-isomerase [Candidatus Peribacteria bacterium]